GGASLDLVDELHARHDLAPHRVLAVEEVRVLEHDEELAARAVGIVGAGHRDSAAHMRLLREFGLERVAHAARAGAGGIAGLRHEAFDHAMERDAVVLALARQLLDLLDVVGREIGKHLDDHTAVLEVDIEGVFLVHGGGRSCEHERDGDEQRHQYQTHHGILSPSDAGRGRRATILTDRRKTSLKLRTKLNHDREAIENKQIFLPTKRSSRSVHRLPWSSAKAGGTVCRRRLVYLPPPILVA